MSTVSKSSQSRSHGSNSTSGTAFVLNTAPVLYDAEFELEVGLFEYKDHEQLRSLRTQYRKSHVVRQHRSFSGKGGSKRMIAAIPIIANAPKVGDTFTSMKLGDNLGHTAALVRESLISYFAAFPRRVFDYRPVTFMCDGKKDNLLKLSLPNGITCPDWLGVVPVYEIEVRVVETARDHPYVSISLSTFTRRRIDATCKQLMDVGFDVVGHYVGRRDEPNDTRIDPRFQLVGRAVSIKDGMIQLSDHRHQVEEISLQEAFIEASAFDAVAKQIIGGAFSQVKSKLDSMTSSFRQGDQKLNRIERLRAHFKDHPLEIVEGETWKCGDFASQGVKGFPKIQVCPPVTYLFDSRKTDTWPVRGIDKNGPYSAPMFSPTEPTICVVCQKEHRGRVEQFIHKFLHGIPKAVPTNGQRPKMQPFDNGFIRKYAIQNVKTEFFEVEGKSAADYRKAIHSAFKARSQAGYGFDLALVEIEESFHGLSGESDPYLIAKAEFLSHQIPVQEFKLETTELPEKRLHYALNNMALATYAKLGGTPWLVQANPPIAHELVIGLGSANVGEGRFGERQRVVGITTVFSGYGNYCVSTVSKAVTYEDYEAELLSSLKETISKVSKSMNWSPNASVRLVFNSFKPFKNIEQDAVKKLVSSLGDYKAEYAFVDVIDKHPFLLFDKQQQGTWAHDGSGKNKGLFAPERGQFLRLSGSESLIVLTGPKELKQAKDGMPSPVLLRLGRGSTFRDLLYLTRQVNTFACHSWRGFDNSPLPVTLGYSNLIARLLGKLNQISFWNPSQMYGKIGDTRWFL